MAWVLLAIVAVFAAQVLFGGKGLAPGKPAPRVRVPMLGGGTALLGDPEEVQVLDFWATWCGPCMESMPVVAKVAGDVAGRGVKLYAVNQDDASSAREERVRGFLRGLGISALPVALDEGAAREQYRINTLPTLYVVARGEVREVHVGGMTESQLRAAILAALPR